MSRMRVTILTGSLQLGGTERNILHLATRLDPRRFEVEVFSDYEGEPIQAELRRRGIPCEALKQAPSIGRPLLSRIFGSNLPYQRRLYRLLRQRRDAVIHAFGFPMIYYAVILARLAGCRRIVFAVQDWDVWKRGPIRGLFYGLLDRLCSAWARRIVADGGGARRLAIERQGMKADRFVVIYNGVNAEELKPDRAPETVRRELGLDPGRPVVGVIGRLDAAKKGQDVFLKAISKIAGRSPGTQFLLVGGGPSLESLMSAACELPPEMRPVFAGMRPDLANALAALDVLVIPSRWESVPKILLEAMWMERPVVATRVGDIQEVLDESCGLLVPPDDPDALADAVCRLLLDPAERGRLAKAGHARIVERKLTLEESVKAYERLYEKLGTK